MAEKKIILSIDDDPMVLRVLTALLTPTFELRISKSATDALALMYQVPPDLILLDIEMPHMSGFDFLRTIKDEPKFKDIPVIIVTGHCETEFIILAERSGAIGIVAKPINKEDLMEKINHGLTGPKEVFLSLKPAKKADNKK